ncbi:MAG: WecB/TagA/CpsF family glycosyltransferase [Xenococcaceae cyanobacterium MO_188.B19]|nr:WecB/TagA/CpsF family glycosyltransferase [Xenococcaceae cyanobacterium MO_188.B19]
MSNDLWRKTKILNIEIDNISSSQLLQQTRNGGVVLTPNVDHLMKLQKDWDFYQLYTSADYIVCDSKIIYWASILLGDRIKEKISGSDFFPLFYKKYQYDREIKIFLLGGTETSVQQAKNNINHKVGRTMVVGAYSPPFGFEKEQAECQKIVDLINSTDATVLAIGVGAPKQEKWIFKHKDRLSKIKIFLAVGETINFEAGATKRAPKWMSQAGLEWLYRLVLEPKRLWKRYLLESIPFFILILLQKINLYRYKQEANLMKIQNLDLLPVSNLKINQNKTKSN